jgi:hypothetical protein
MFLARRGSRGGPAVAGYPLDFSRLEAKAGTACGTQMPLFSAPAA